MSTLIVYYSLKLIDPLRKKSIENEVAIRDFSDRVYNL